MLEKIKSLFTQRWMKFVISAVLILLVLLFIRNCKADPSVNEQLEEAKKEALYWKDKYGNQQVTVQRLTVEKATMKAVVDSIADVLKIRKGQITTITDTKIIIDTVIKPVYVLEYRIDTIYLPDSTSVYDTVPIYSINYRDSSFLSIQGKIPSNEGLKISVGARLITTNYTQKSWLFGKKRYYTGISTDNPYIKFSNTTSIERKDKPTLKIRPGIGIGANYNPVTHRVDPITLQGGIYLFYSK